MYNIRGLNFNTIQCYRARAYQAEDNEFIIAVEFEGQRYSTGEAVIITYDCDDYVSGKVRSVRLFQ